MKALHFLGKILISIVLSLLLPSVALANHIPPPSGFVNDFAHVLTSDQASQLETSLQSYEKQTTNEISIATVKSLNGDDINDFTVRTFEEWKIGKKGKDNGVLILAAIDEKKIRIEVGYGLEPKVTDSQAGSIIRDVITPQFKSNNYYQGFADGISAIESAINSEPLPTQSSSVSNLNPKAVIDLLFLAVFLFHLLIVYLASFLGRSKSIWAGGIMGAILGLVIGLFVAILLFKMLFVILFGGLGLLLDWYLSNRYTVLKKSGKKTDWWSTGGGFFGGRSGGGFGGFGGGGSGGGGASGGW